MNDCQSKMYRMLREDDLLPNARRISSTPCQKVVKLYRWNSWLPGCYQILKLRNKLMRFLPTARARSITFNADESLTVAKAEQVENNVDALWNLIVLDFIDVATDVFAYTATGPLHNQVNRPYGIVQMLLID